MTSGDDTNKRDNRDPLDPFPPDLDRLTIGTAINTDTNSIIYGTEAFDVPLLIKSELLRIPPEGGDEVSTEVRGGGSDIRSQETSGWNALGSFGWQTGFIDVAADFYVKQTVNTCNRETDATIVGFCHAKTSAELKRSTAQQYYNCTTPIFRQYIEAVEYAAEASASPAAPTFPGPWNHPHGATAR